MNAIGIIANTETAQDCCGVASLRGIQKQVQTNKYIISNKELLEALETHVLVSIGELILWMTVWTGMD